MTTQRSIVFALLFTTLFAFAASTELPHSLPEQLLVAEITLGGSSVIIARSYHGHPWEAVPVLGQQIDLHCNQTNCTLNTKTPFRVREIPIPSQVLSHNANDLAARLLQQATFGGSRADIAYITKTYGTNFGQWIREQLRMTPTFTRTHYRSRVNPRRLVNNLVTREIGPQSEPCDMDTRWHQFVFELRDKNQDLLVRTNEVPNRFTLHIGGYLRGEVSTFLGQPFPGTTIKGVTFPATFRICAVEERLGGRVGLSNNGGTTCSLSYPNPPINITLAGSPVQVIGVNDAKFVPVVGSKAGAFILKSRTVPCKNMTDRGGNTFIRQGDYTYRFDKRIRFVLNTLENPSAVTDSTDGQCPIVAESYLNRNSCVRRSACSASSVTSFKSAPFTLNDTIIRAWYTLNKRYVYVIKGLRLEAPFDISPCKSVTSRWMKIENTTCTNPTDIDPATLSTIVKALTTSTDTNPYLRDISITSKNCTDSPATIGAQVTAKGACWQHVHPDLLSVRDATLWTQIHDGNAQAKLDGNPNPIMKWADNGSISITFPGFHTMIRWQLRRPNLPVIGRYGDVVDFMSLTTELQTEQFAKLVGAIRTLPDGAEAPEACGSPGEVDNIPELGNHYIAYVNMSVGEEVEQLEYQIPMQEDFTYVLYNVHLTAKDQLRQRLAWSLNNFIVAAPTDIGLRDYPEAWLTFYDIFIRGATGSFLDILRDVSYSPTMGLYLTYARSRAFAITRTSPDENYAREIMQLFTVGLWKLNDDGSQRLDASGQPMPTYTNDDILDYARLWTGFDLVPSRPNVGDATNGMRTSNLIDPMVIKAAGHDRLPKAKLDSGHIGDGYPLCDDLPPQSFLREGARFEFTGDISAEGDTLDQAAPALAGRRGRFEPTPGQSALWNTLCAPAAGGRCTFPESVTLKTNLPCNSTQECNAGRVRVVKITDPVARKTKYYTYIPLPCVRLTFFENGHILKRASTRSQCADPATAVGAPVCCNATDTSRSVNRFGSECLFAAETTDLATAQARCNQLGLVLCSEKLRDQSTFNNTCAPDMYMWTSGSCTVQIQVYPSGQVGIIDANATQFFLLSKSSLNNVFRPRWWNNTFPSGKNGTCPSSCLLQTTPNGPSCICNISVTSRAIFSKLSALSAIAGPLSVSGISSRAFIGAPKPSSFNADTYSQCTTDECKALGGGVIVWLHQTDKDGLLSEKTIFELPPYRRGRPDRFLFNRVSIVRVGTSFSFRNPPHFSPLLGEQVDMYRDYLSDNLWTRQAENEVDALLIHLFEHTNTAPYVCYRLIQQLVTSNPSPRYVRTVVNAFRSGAYGNVQFSNQYGDLSATVYAILMDREARSVLLEADPTFGMLRDPLIKLYHVMRSLEYRSPIHREVALNSLMSRIGVQPLRQPNVFSYYSPAYQPAGAVASAKLVSPQAQVTTSPNIIGFLNGVTSLVDNGLTSCFAGFGVGQRPGPGCTADGSLEYTPAPNATSAQIIDELDLLLTAKRLNSTVRQYFISQYDSTLKLTGDSTIALKMVIKMFLSSLEFHTTNLNVPKQQLKRKPPPTVTSSGRPFKAIVVIFEAGGCDSWNKIVPHSDCPAKDLYKEYSTVRGGAAISQNLLLPVTVPKGTQPCNNFGIHPAMPKQRDLYNQKELAFLTNIGALVEPTTKAQMNARTVTLPPSLFAHDVMQRSIQNLHAQEASAQGVLGRIVETLTAQASPFKSALFSYNGPVKMVQGKVPADMLSASGGITRFNLFKTLSNSLNNLTQFVSSSLFAETYADILTNSLRNTEYLGGLLQNTTLKANFTNSGFSQQMQMTAKLIKALSKQTDVERATFFVARGGYDTHATFNLSPLYGDIDAGLGSFAAEMKAQGMWDNVVVVSISDFARTLYSNGAGTDHAWGGQHIVAGGKVKGGQIFGSYPDTLTDESNLSLGRGRLIPTLPFESVWNGIAQWFGVSDDKMSYVLPNARKFNATAILSQDELFRP